MDGTFRFRLADGEKMMSTDSVCPSPFPCGEGRFSNAVLVSVHHCDELERGRSSGHGVARAPRPQAPRAPRTEMDWLLVCTVRPAWLIIPGTENCGSYSDYGHHFKGFLIGCVYTTLMVLLFAGVDYAILQFVIWG